MTPTPRNKYSMESKGLYADLASASKCNRRIQSPINNMPTSSRVVHVGLVDGLAKGPPPTGNLAVPIFSHGSLVVELYTPVGNDPQKPHTRDEVYCGHGSFFDGEQRHSVQTGSFLFVPAGHIHRFEEFSSDFVVWVVFYGPEGGEVPF